MKYRSIAAILTAAALILGCMAGCKKSEKTASKGDSAANQTQASGASVPGSDQNPQGGGQDQIPESRRLGQVTAIDGTSVTLVLDDGQMGGGGMPGGNSQQPPEGGNGQHPPEGGNRQQPPEGGNGQHPPEGGNGQQPPEEGNGQQPPDQGGQKPDGQGMQGFPGFTAGSETVTLTLDESVASAVSVGDLMLVTMDENNQPISAEPFDSTQMGGPGGMPGGPGGQMPGGQGSAVTGTAANTAEADVDGGSFDSSAEDENALLIDGKTVTLKQISLTKTGESSNTEQSDFYGINAGLLATNGADVTVEGGSFTTDGAGANAMFCYGTGTTLRVKDAVIRTSSRNSGGIQTAGGGTTVAENLDIETAGASAAAIRSDRGGGTVTVTGGSYVTNGTGSPAIYSTAQITVNDAVLTANASEAVVVEGKNAVTLNNCTLSGNMQGTYGKDSSENLQTVMIYQSMSGDAETGAGSFTMTGGSLTAWSGDLFYVTNTTATIALTGVELSPANGILLRASGNDGSRGWGAAGANGAVVTMTADAQSLRGTILVDEISSLDLTLTGNSSFEGTVNPDGAAGRVSVKLEAGCSWTLTGDAYVSSFEGDLSAVDANGFHLYVSGEQAV